MLQLSASTGGLHEDWACNRAVEERLIPRSKSSGFFDTVPGGLCFSCHVEAQLYNHIAIPVSCSSNFYDEALARSISELVLQQFPEYQESPLCGPSVASRRRYSKKSKARKLRVYTGKGFQTHFGPGPSPSLHHGLNTTAADQPAYIYTHRRSSGPNIFRKRLRKPPSKSPRSPLKSPFSPLEKYLHFSIPGVEEYDRQVQQRLELAESSDGSWRNLSSSEGRWRQFKRVPALDPTWAYSSEEHEEHLREADKLAESWGRTESKSPPELHQVALQVWKAV